MIEQPNPPTEGEEEPKLTAEEYEKARKEAMSHLKKEIGWLNTEAEYEKLQADIEEHKTRRISMIAQQARFFAQQQAAKDPPAETPPEVSKPPRKLKNQ